MRSWFPLILLAAIAFLTQRAGADESRAIEGQLLSRLRSEAVVEWRAMERQLNHCHFEYRIIETDRDGGLTMKREKRVTGQLFEESFLITESIAALDQISVFGRNERYEFAITRDGEAPWTVTSQSGRGEEDTPVESAYAYLSGMLRLPWQISATPLERLVHDSRFNIRAVTTHGDGRIAIDFNVAAVGASEDALQGLSSGKFLVAPSRRWAMTEYAVKYANRISASAKLDYSRSGPPELQHVFFEIRTTPRDQSQFDINIEKYERVGESRPDIRLTAFGLPEYKAPAGRRWLFLLNIGFILILGGLILWRRRREATDL